MKGGLLQLATVGKEDSLLIGKPEITHFEKVYMKYTNFSIDNYHTNYGDKKFDSEFELNIKRDGDLLKDMFFYLEIPYFEILKKIKTEKKEFTKEVSDKLYYQYLNMKSFVYLSSENNFYIIPENMLYYPHKLSENKLNTNEIISITSQEYSKYFNNESRFKDITFNEDSKHPSIPYMKTVDSFWFNSFINEIIDDVDENNFILLLDYNKFTEWFNHRVEYRLFMNYHLLFNLNEHYIFYQINFTITNSRKINEVKKYFEIKDKFDYLTETSFINEDLDIDIVTHNIVSTNLFNKNEKEINTYLLNTVLYNCRFILFILGKLYDDSQSSFFTFFKMFKVSDQTENKVIGSTLTSYENGIWDTYISDFFTDYFDNNNINKFSSHITSSFLEQSNLLEKDVDNLWTTLTMQNNSNEYHVDYIFSILYTFIQRYEKFFTYNTVNFLDFFTREGDPTFFESLNTNFSSYKTLNLTTIYNSHGKKFDLTLLYNYLVYVLTYLIKDFNIFEEFKTISKQNIQFIYWWRNKIANSIFLRYKRVQNSNLYPNFDNMKEHDGLINMFYTYLPNNVISLEEIKNDLYRLFYNYSYKGVLTNDSNNSSIYQTITKLTQITSSTYSNSSTSTIECQYKYDINSTLISQDGNKVSLHETLDAKDQFFDNRFKVEFLINDKYYNVTTIYEDASPIFILEDYIKIITNFEIIVTVNIPINKYFVDYDPLVINDSELEFVTGTQIFTYDKYIDTDNFNFKLIREPNKVISEFNILDMSAGVDTPNTYSNVLTNYDYVEHDLFNNTTSINYTININERKSYTNLSASSDMSNFNINTDTINSEIFNILNIVSSEENYFTLNTSSIYKIIHASITYNITLTELSTNKYRISGVDVGKLDDVNITDVNITTYYLEENIYMLKPTIFELTTTSTNTINSTSFTNINTDTGIFDYSGNIHSDYNLILSNNRYYQVDISNNGTPNTYQVTSDKLENINLASCILYTNYRITFDTSTILDLSKKYYLTFLKASTLDTEQIDVIPVLTNNTNFDKTKNNKHFKYQLKSKSTTYDGSKTFKINLSNKLDDNTELFIRKNNTVTKNNIMIGGQIILNKDDNHTYYLKTMFLDSTIVKKKIVFSKSSSLNDTYFVNIKDNIYYINEEINFDKIEKISIQTVRNMYDEVDMSGIIEVNESDSIFLKIPISDINSDNYENYYKYIKHNIGTYYIKDGSGNISLGQPTVTNNNSLNFKLMNISYTKYLPTTTSRDYTIIVFNNNYLPNLLPYTSFYLQDNINKVSDLMDYFIQTPMVIFLDKETVKNSNVILYNLPFNLEKADQVKYITIDGEYLHLNELLNSNQLLRHQNSLISSSFDYDIIEFNLSNNIAKRNLIRGINTVIERILDTFDIRNIINKMESTNNFVNSFFQDNFINKIYEGDFGKTIQKLLEQFNSSNLVSLLDNKNQNIVVSNIEENNKISKYAFNIYKPKNNIYYNYNLYSKYALDFYNSNDGTSLDINLNYTTSKGSGREIFATNYKPFLNEIRLNTEMLLFLNEYKNEIEKQINYVEDNMLWLDIGNKSTSNSFDYFYGFQQQFRNYIYADKTVNKYKFKYLYNDEFLLYPELDKKNYYDSIPITITSDLIETDKELRPVRKSAHKYIDNNSISQYMYIKDFFNYLGPGLVKDNIIVKDTLNFNYDISKNYMFIDDTSSCYLSTFISKNEFTIEDNLNKVYKSSYVKEIDSTFTYADLGIIDDDIYLYIFDNTNSSLAVNDFLLIDNVLCRVISNTYGDNNYLALLSYYSVSFQNSTYYVGTIKSSGYTYSSTDSIVLKDNLTNVINFSTTEHTLDKLVTIKFYNKQINDNTKIYCTLNDGILNIETIQGLNYVFITNTTIYSLGNTVISNKPLILQNKKVYYHLINKLLEDSTYIFNEDIIQKLSDMGNSTIPENLWFFNGDIGNSFKQEWIKLDIDTKNIYIDDRRYNEIQFLFFMYNNIFYKFSDFTRVMVDDDLYFTKIYFINPNRFIGNKSFYSYNTKVNTSIDYNPIKNCINTSNTNLIYYDVSGHNKHLIDTKCNTSHDINIFFDNNITRPLTVNIIDTTTPVKKLKYSLFSDSSLNTEIDSIFQITESYLDSSSNLTSDTSFYLRFDLSSSALLENGPLTKYYFDSTKVSYIDIKAINNDTYISMNDTSSNVFEFKILNGTHLIKGNFKKLNFKVDFVYENIPHTFDIITRILIDDNYTQKLEMTYNNESYVYLHEPYIILDINNKFKDSNNLDFSGCIPNIFEISVANNYTIIPNISETITNVNSYDRYLQFMNIDNTNTTDYYKDIKQIECSRLTDQERYYELIDNITIYENKIYIKDNYKEYINQIKSCIVTTNKKTYFLNIKKIENNYITVHHTFTSIESTGILYFNLFEGKIVERPFFINKNTYIIYIIFGSFNLGEIVSIGDVTLLINKYDLKYKGYSFEIISNHTINELNTMYQTYFSIGSISNFNIKNSIINFNFEENNMFISKTKDKIEIGDFIYTGQNMGYYDNETIVLSEKSINFGFNNKGNNIFIQKSNDKWKYFGSDFNGFVRVVARYTDGDVIKKAILIIKYVINHHVFWREDDYDYQPILDNLVDIYKDSFIFYLPYQPFVQKYLDITGSRVSFDYGMIHYDGTNHLIDNGKVLGLTADLSPGIYKHIKLNKKEFSEISKYNYSVYNFDKVNFDDVTLYKSSNIYFDGVDTNTSLDMSFNSASPYYYYDTLTNKYKYPVYLTASVTESHITAINVNSASTNTNDLIVYHDSSNISYSDNIPADHLNINDSFYVFNNSKYYYPVYINYTKFNDNNIINSLNNLVIKAEAVDLINHPKITSLVNTVGIVGTAYTYNIVTNPSNCTIITEKLPNWLILNNNSGVYSLSGTPDSSNIGYNIVNIVATDDSANSMSQKFDINVTESSSPRITSTPSTFGYVGYEYTYDISMNDDFASTYVISKPSWLHIDNAEYEDPGTNHYYGTPNLSSVGDNILVLHATDINDNTTLQKFNIFVDYKYAPYFTSTPVTEIIEGINYSYDILVNNNNNDDVTLIGSVIPSWLTLTDNNLSGTYDGNTEYDVILEIFSNNLITTQSFTIDVSSTNLVEFTSQPITTSVNNKIYSYKVSGKIGADNTTGKEIYIRATTIPAWLTLDADYNLTGTPTNYYLGDNNVILRISDNLGNSKTQQFSIHVFDNQDKIIKINDNLFDKVLKHNLYDYNSDIILNSNTYKFKNLINHTSVNASSNYSVLDVNNYVDLSGKVDILLPINHAHSDEYSINSNYVSISNKVLSYRYKTSEENNNNCSKLFCYYNMTSNAEQIQLRTFDIKLYNDYFDVQIKSTSNTTTTSGILFDLFYRDFSNSTNFFIDNYIPINITSLGSTESRKYFNKLPFDINLNDKVLIEERRYDETIIHYSQLIFEDGQLKTLTNISNNDSLFYLHRLIPIKIKTTLIEFENPILHINDIFGVNSIESIDNYMPIPIKILSKPSIVNNKWKVEISSKYLILMDKYDIYPDIKVNDIVNDKLSIVMENNKVYLLFNKIPTTKNSNVYIVKKSYFQYLSKNNLEWKTDDQLNNKKPSDLELENYLSDNWNIGNEQASIPVSVESSNILQRYVLQNYIKDNIDLNSPSIKYYLSILSNNIKNLGINEDNKLEISVEKEIINLDTNLYISYPKSGAITEELYEPISSVNKMVDMFEGINTTIYFNMAKSLEDWTSITFYNNSQYKNQVFAKHINVDSSGNILVSNDTSGSVLLLEETLVNSNLQKVAGLLGENNFVNYNKLLEIRKVEEVIFNYIRNNSKNYYFWDTPIENINKFLNAYNGDVNTRDYIIYKKCIVTKVELEDGSVINDTIFKEIDDKSIRRIAYLDSQFILNKTSDISLYISRFASMVTNNINNFINASQVNSSFGVDSHILFDKILKISAEKGEFIKYILDGNSFNYNYGVLTFEKLLLSKQWDKILETESEYKEFFNSEFNDKLDITYKQDDNWSATANYSGYKVDTLGNLIPFGLYSHNSIIKSDINQDIIVHKTYSFDNIKYSNESTIKYKLESDKLFKYEITSSTDILFKTDQTYTLDLLTGDNVFKEDVLNINKQSSNKIVFNSEYNYDDFTKISLSVDKSYNIISSESKGYFYQNYSINDISSGSLSFFLDDNSIIINSYVVDSSSTKFNLISSVELKNEDFIKIEQLISIKDQKLRTISSEDRLYISITDNLSKSNLKTVSNEVFITIDSNDYRIIPESYGIYNYYILRNTLINKFTNYSVFVYYQLGTIESYKTDLSVYDIFLEEHLDNINYKVHSPLPINYNIDNSSISNIEFIKEDVARVFTTNEIITPKVLNNNFKIEKNTPNIIKDLSFVDNPFLIEVVNLVKLLDDAQVQFISTGNPSITGIVNPYTTDLNFLYRTVDKYTAHDLSNHNIEITNIVNVTLYDYIDNFVSFMLTDDLTISLESSFKYYIDISGSYNLLDNQNIYMNNNIVTIDLTDFGNFTSTAPFNFKQVYTSPSNVIPYKYNQIMTMELHNDYIIRAPKHINIQYLDSNFKESGNYIYYFSNTNGLSFSSSESYRMKKIEYSDKYIDIKVVGEKNGNIYFSTIEPLVLTGGINYNLYSINYSINIVLDISTINYQSNSFFNALITKVTNNKTFEIQIETADTSSNIIILPDNSNFSLFMSDFNNVNSELDLISLSKISYKFPDELRYSNYYQTDVSETIVKENIIWKEDFAYNIFDYIEFYMNNQKVDVLDKNVYKIMYKYLNKQKEMMMYPKIKDNKFYLYLPTMFWFNQSSSNYLPLITLENTNITVKLKLNKLENMISNNISNYDIKLPDYVKFSMITDTILLDSVERQRFAEYNHEYLIERFVSYNPILIKEERKTINLNIKGLIKDIFWVCESKTTGKNYLSDIENVKDHYYQEYIDLYTLYKKYIQNNRTFSQDIPTSYLSSFLQLDTIENYVTENSETILKYIRNNKMLVNYDLKFILYLYFVKLSYYDNYNDSYFGTNANYITNNRIREKFSKLIAYFSKIHTNKNITTEIKPIKEIDFKANGRSLLSEHNYTYYNSVVPYEKFKRSFEPGLSGYSFALDPTSLQPSGQLNFNILNEPTLNVIFDKKVVNENLFLYTVVKEYQILRIIGGNSSLSWV